MKHLPWICILLLFVAPMLAWGIFSFWGVLGGGQAISDSFPVSTLIRVMARTHLLAGATAVISVMVALPAALWAYLKGGWFRRVCSFVLLVPLAIGMLARNFAWIGMLSQQGILESMGWDALHGRDMLYTPWAVHLVMTFIFLPWAYYILRGGLFSIRDLHIDAALSLGAPPRRVLTHVILPILLQPTLVAILLIYCSALGYFITPRMVGGNEGVFAGNAILVFVDLAQFEQASEIALALLLSAVPVAGCLMWLVSGKHKAGTT